jgi:ABC-type nitrate/sulfonate/bicarbonate transport system ATPase subunit
MLEVSIQSKVFATPGRAPRQILADIAFNAVPGEILAILGPSGIGKSSILRIVLGLDHNFQGSVRRPPGRIGVMFQEPRLPPWLTVAENLRLVQPDANVSGLLEEVMLPGVEAQLPSALSLGMARRASFARALAVDPQMLVLDEPFASLDRNLGGDLCIRVAERARRFGTLVLLTTHDLDQALTMATRVLLLAGSPATLAADIVVPNHADGVAITRLRQNLLTRFAFLGQPERTEP